MCTQHWYTYVAELAVGIVDFLNAGEGTPGDAVKPVLINANKTVTYMEWSKGLVRHEDRVDRNGGELSNMTLDLSFIIKQFQEVVKKSYL